MGTSNKMGQSINVGLNFSVRSKEQYETAARNMFTEQLYPYVYLYIRIVYCTHTYVHVYPHHHTQYK